MSFWLLWSLYCNPRDKRWRLHVRTIQWPLCLAQKQLHFLFIFLFIQLKFFHFFNLSNDWTPVQSTLKSSAIDTASQVFSCKWYFINLKPVTKPWTLMLWAHDESRCVCVYSLIFFWFLVTHSLLSRPIHFPQTHTFLKYTSPQLIRNMWLYSD